jgi:hypothetical protein
VAFNFKSVTRKPAAAVPSSCGECGKATKTGYGRGDKFLCDACHENQIRRETRELYNENLPVDKTVSVKFRKFQIKGMAKDSQHRA